jgi:predicted ester cyclase
MSVAENKVLVQRLYEAFDRGNLDAVSESVASNFVANVLGTTILDWAGFEEFCNASQSAFPDGRHVFDYVIADAENVVTIGSYQGTQMGPMNDITPTDREIRLPVMHLDRVSNGKIVEHRGLANEYHLMQQLGINVS